MEESPRQNTGWDNTIPVPPPVPVGTEAVLPYAGSGRRSAAMAVDLLIASLLFLPLAMVAAGGPETALSGWSRRFFIDLLPAMVVILFWHRFGATPGKRLLELRVVAVADGGPVSVKRAVLRYIGYYLSALPLYLGFLWILWDRRRQGFHDKIAGTTVIHAEEDESQKDLATLMREAEWTN